MKMVGNIPKWKHNKFHKSIINNYGNAAKCEHCKSTTAKRYEWCLREGHEYSSNPEDYLQLCTSCHRKYDFNESIRTKLKVKKQGESHNMAKLSEAKVLEIYDLLKTGVQNNQIAKGYNLDPSTISDIKRGKRWTELFKKYHNEQ